MLARVMGGNSGWDIVFPTDYLVQPMLAQSLLAPLRHNLLPHLDQLETLFKRPAWDPDLRWSVPYMVTAAGIAYNRALKPVPVASAESVERAASRTHDHAGRSLRRVRSLSQAHRFSINTSDPAQLKRAQAEAIAQKPRFAPISMRRLATSW